MVDGDYEPGMPGEDVAWIRDWHERAYRETSSTGQPRRFEYLGRVFVVPPQVHPIVGMSDLLGSAVLTHTRLGDRVLDMGTGCGVNAVLAAGVSRDVVAVDVNPIAVAAARANAELNGVADRVDVRRSDVFDGVDGDFDLIVFDPPFRWFAPRSLLEAASTDENYRTLGRFFDEVGGRLRPDGRMLVFFGSTGDLGHLHRLIAGHGFGRSTVAHRDLTRAGRTVDYYTYLLTRVGQDGRGSPG